LLSQQQIAQVTLSQTLAAAAAQAAIGQHHAEISFHRSRGIQKSQEQACHASSKDCRTESVED
jgi:hypothetical protein